MVSERSGRNRDEDVNRAICCDAGLPVLFRPGGGAGGGSRRNQVKGRGHGVFKPRIPVPFPAHDARWQFSPPASGEKLLAAAYEPCVLCVGRAVVCPGDAGLDRLQLCRRAVSAAGAIGGRSQGVAVLRHRREPDASGDVQIPEFHHVGSEALAAGLPGRHSPNVPVASDWHFLLYVSGDQLFGRVRRNASPVQQPAPTLDIHT